MFIWLKINDIPYTCDLDTAASDIFLSTSAATKSGLEIRSSTEPATLGDFTTISTTGMTTASICEGDICSEEEVKFIPLEEDTGV